MRPSLDTYFMEIAEVVKTRSTCNRRSVGAVLVRDNQIISTGYNGAPAKTDHCLGRQCLRDELNIPSGFNHEICRGGHSEQNAIAQAAKNGVCTNDSVLYITHSPCSLCVKVLINAGVKEIVFRDNYPDELAKQLMHEAGIKIKKINY